jgi:hypothetical protein
LKFRAAFPLSYTGPNSSDKVGKGQFKAFDNKEIFVYDKQ